MVNIPLEIVPEYPYWKTVAWRVLRAFVAGFVSTLGLLLSGAASVGFKGFDGLETLAVSMLGGAISGGLQGIGKFLRDEFGNYEQTSPVDKLPF